MTKPRYTEMCVRGVALHLRLSIWRAERRTMLVEVEPELLDIHQAEVLQLLALAGLVGVEHDAEWHGHVDCGLLDADHAPCVVRVFDHELDLARVCVPSDERQPLDGCSRTCPIADLDVLDAAEPHDDAVGRVHGDGHVRGNVDPG